MSRKLPTKHVHVDWFWLGQKDWRPHPEEVKSARLREAKEALRIEETNGNTTSLEGCGDGRLCTYCDAQGGEELMKMDRVLYHFEHLDAIGFGWLQGVEGTLLLYTLDEFGDQYLGVPVTLEEQIAFETSKLSVRSLLTRPHVYLIAADRTFQVIDGSTLENLPKEGVFLYP